MQLHFGSITSSRSFHYTNNEDISVVPLATISCRNDDKINPTHFSMNLCVALLLSVDRKCIGAIHPSYSMKGLFHLSIVSGKSPQFPELIPSINARTVSNILATKLEHNGHQATLTP